MDLQGRIFKDLTLCRFSLPQFLYYMLYWALTLLLLYLKYRSGTLTDKFEAEKAEEEEEDAENDSDLTNAESGKSFSTKGTEYGSKISDSDNDAEKASRSSENGEISSTEDPKTLDAP